jgi:hypothetical protein
MCYENLYWSPLNHQSKALRVELKLRHGHIFANDIEHQSGALNGGGRRAADLLLDVVSQLAPARHTRGCDVFPSFLQATTRPCHPRRVRRHA